MNETYIYELDRYDVARHLYLDCNNATYLWLHFGRELVCCTERGETDAQWLHWVRYGFDATKGKPDMRKAKKAIFELCRMAGYHYEGNL